MYGIVLCFWEWVSITGLNRSNFDNKAVTFEHHIKREHNMWNYLYFMVLLKTKDPTEFTGSECYVSKALKVCGKCHILSNMLN